MNKLQIIDNAINVKETIGSFKLFDEIDPVDHPVVYDFLRIVRNYIKITEIHGKEN